MERLLNLPVLTAEEKLKLLEKPLWDYNDIRKYFHTGKNKAIDIKNAARKCSNNLPKFDSSKATVDAIMQVQGLDVQAEIARLKAITCADDFTGVICHA